VVDITAHGWAGAEPPAESAPENKSAAR
jgi:hypothetical protein